MGTTCPVCDGTGYVVWSKEVPRPAGPDLGRAEQCPACDGSGVEPNGDRSNE